MDLEFDITQSFNEDISRLPPSQRENISGQVNIISQSLLNRKAEFKENASIPYHFNLKGGLESSLVLIKVDQDYGIVAAVDEDPIFDKISLTLFRVVEDNNSKKIYKEIGNELYTKLGML